MSQPWPFAPIPDTAPALGDPLDLLHRAFDGGLPRRARLVALVGGEGEWAARRRDTQALLAARACADAVRAVALRRQMVSARAVRRDRWLSRLVATVAQARHQTAALAGNG